MIFLMLYYPWMCVIMHPRLGNTFQLAHMVNIALIHGHILVRNETIQNLVYKLLSFSFLHHLIDGLCRSKASWWIKGDSKVIQRCFDDNSDDDKRWWQRWWQKAQRSIKKQLKRIQDQSRTIQEFKIRIKKNSRFKNEEETQSRSRFKTQDPKMKRRLNQDKY